MPYYFQTLSPDYQSYNYGFLAYSPLHMLARLQQMEIRKEIVQSDGFGVFTLINDHLDRVIPATRWIEMTKGYFPYIDEGTMVTNGVFAKQRRLYSDFIQAFQDSGVKQLSNWGYPKRHTDVHFEFIADIIGESARTYSRIFGNDHFFVIIFPGNPVSASFLQKLSHRGIKYLDYSGLITINDKMLPFDNAHPSATVYRRVASRLSEDLAVGSGKW